MNPNDLLIKVPASDPPKDYDYYHTDKGICHFNAMMRGWYNCYGVLKYPNHYYRPASIQEIKKMFGLFDKEEMKKAISFGRDYDYYEASILDENEDTIENWFRNFYPKQLNYNTDQNGKENA